MKKETHWHRYDDDRIERVKRKADKAKQRFDANRTKKGQSSPEATFWWVNWSFVLMAYRQDQARRAAEAGGDFESRIMEAGKRAMERVSKKV